MKKTPELFDQWNEKKKDIEFCSTHTHDVRIWDYRRYREWVNIWNEISKDWRFMRVCLVLETRVGNWLLLVAPITTKYHNRMNKYYVTICNYQKFWLRESRVIINQIKLIDRKRLVNMPLKNVNHSTLVSFVLWKYYSLIIKKHSKLKARSSGSTKTT